MGICLVSTDSEGEREMMAEVIKGSGDRAGMPL